MVVAHGHFPTLAPLLEGPLCLVEEEVRTFSHWLGLHGGESPWLAVSKRKLESGEETRNIPILINLYQCIAK